MEWGYTEMPFAQVRRKEEGGGKTEEALDRPLSTHESPRKEEEELDRVERTGFQGPFHIS